VIHTKKQFLASNKLIMNLIKSYKGPNVSASNKCDKRKTKTENLNNYKNYNITMIQKKKK